MCHHQQVPEHSLVALFCTAELRQAIPHLGNNKKVDRRLGQVLVTALEALLLLVHSHLWVDVPKRKRGVILVDDLGWDLLGNDLVKYGWCPRVGSPAY